MNLLIQYLHLTFAIWALGVANASKPHFSIKVQDGTATGLQGLDPSVEWQSSTHMGVYDVEFGADIALRPTMDFASLLRTFWGQLSRPIGASWRVSARTDVNAQDLSDMAIHLDGTHSKLDFGTKCTVQTGGKIAIREIKAFKNLNFRGANISIHPRYSVQQHTSDVLITCQKHRTGIKYQAYSRPCAHQTLTVSQVLNQHNVITPTIKSNGAISMDWLLRLNDRHAITTTWKPFDSLTVLWKDGPWKTTISAPLTGFIIDDVTVSVKRDLGF